MPITAKIVIGDSTPLPYEHLDIGNEVEMRELNSFWQASCAGMLLAELYTPEMKSGTFWLVLTHWNS